MRAAMWPLLAALSVGCTCQKPGDSQKSTAALQASLPQVWPGAAPSCRELPATCGPSRESCCTSLIVPGGTFARSYDGVDYLKPNAPATLSDFYLDKYEITVGRLRAFVHAGMGTQQHPPTPGAGAHPKIERSGWKPEWNAHLPADTAALRAALQCYIHATWTDAPGAAENKPVNCLDWYTTFAFCAWDGGRVPTEAEWNYAASGGNEHRYYPWSVPPTSTTIDDTFAVFCGGTCKYEVVGARSPKGDGKWGHADLGGSAWEWNLDWDPVVYPVPCIDCAPVDTGEFKSARSGSNDDIAPTLRSATRHVHAPHFRLNIGGRCARSP